MNKLAQDLVESLAPEILIVRSIDFRDQEEMEEYIRTHPARNHLKVIRMDVDQVPIFRQKENAQSHDDQQEG